MPVNTITITLPPAAASLHAHAKGHWRVKANATKQLRTLAAFLAKASRKKLTGRVQVHYRFFVPDRRRRDEANLIQSCKPAIDGVVDAGAIEGDHWEKLTTGSVGVVVDKTSPRVELVFEQVESVRSG
jgi:hypothetical protein